MENDDISQRSREEVIAAVKAALQDERADDGFEAQVVLLTFPVGHIVVTPGALEGVASENGKNRTLSLRDWS